MSLSFRPGKDLRIILRDLGLLLPVVGVMATVSLVIPLAFREHYAILPLLITAVISFILGGCLYLPFRSAGEAKLQHGMIIAALGWLMVAVLGSLPFFLTASFAQSAEVGSTALADFANPLNGFFEAMSGFTTTGLSVASDSAELPKTLQWWRSFTQWIGGLGIIVVVLAILVGPRPGSGTHSLYRSEARAEKIHPTIVSTLRTMWWIFLLYTFIGVIALWGAGMPIWGAINHSMTTLSTGGFSVTGESIAAYGSIAIELLCLPIMFLGAVSFITHYKLMRGTGRILWRDIQTRWLIIVMVAGSGLLVLENVVLLGEGQTLRESIFQFVSALTTTGFQTADVRSWSITAKLLLTGGMLIGGAAGSTAGGIKVIRVLTLIKGVQWRFRKIIAPREAVVPFRFGSVVLDDADVSERIEDASLIASSWLVFLAVGIAVLLHTVPDEFTLSDVVFEVTSAQCTVGLSTGITGPAMSALGKVMLCFNMWIGRLEIIPVLILLRSLFLAGR